MYDHDKYLDQYNSCSSEGSMILRAYHHHTQVPSERTLKLMYDRKGHKQWNGPFILLDGVKYDVQYNEEAKDGKLTKYIEVYDGRELTYTGDYPSQK